jgi:hypothetical protein
MDLIIKYYRGNILNIRLVSMEFNKLILKERKIIIKQKISNILIKDVELYLTRGTIMIDNELIYVLSIFRKEVFELIELYNQLRNNKFLRLYFKYLNTLLCRM